MKFIIYWMLTVAYPGGCGSPPPTVDEFGRVTYSNATYAGICYTYNKEPRSKVFHNADSANIFYDKISKESKRFKLQKYTVLTANGSFEKIDTVGRSDVSAVRMEVTKIVKP